MGEDVSGDTGGGFDFLGSLKSGADLVVQASGIVKSAQAQVAAQQIQQQRVIAAANANSTPAPLVGAAGNKGSGMLLLLLAGFVVLKVLL